MLQEMVQEVERFLNEVAKEVEETVDAFVEASLEVTDDLINQLQITLERDIEPQINAFFDPILEAYLGLEGQIEESARPMVNTVEPILNDHRACVGCKHYHGQAYDGVMLVCGMHPYGWEEEKCPDWESAWNE